MNRLSGDGEYLQICQSTCDVLCTKISIDLLEDGCFGTKSNLSGCYSMFTGRYGILGIGDVEGGTDGRMGGEIGITSSVDFPACLTIPCVRYASGGARDTHERLAYREPFRQKPRLNDDRASWQELERSRADESNCYGTLPVGTRVVN